MEMNFLVLALAALIPMVLGFIWYNPKTMGAAWMKESGMTEEKAKSANMPLIFGLSYVFSFLTTLALQSIVIHQWGVFSVLINEPGFMEEGSEINTYFKDFMANYGNNFRTFKHGALHGGLTGAFLAFPILATNGMFEQRSWKLTFINTGYWAITFALMGGVICQFA